MRTIFEQGIFNNYSRVELKKSMSPILESSQYGIRIATVFISHKHDDLNDLKGLLGFLEKHYNVKVYIDSQDPQMPKITSAKTALNIKERIKQCNKFILLATNGAIESKWCNWELGYGDAQKYKKNIALFPMKPKGKNDNDYKGNEYMSIYPHIAYFEGTEVDCYGEKIPEGFYIIEKDSSIIIPLGEWFRRKD